jgi:RHS repeat-associated protein
MVSYTSDGTGLRQSRTIGTTTRDFLWSTGGGLPLLLDDGLHSYLYGPSSAPLAQIDDGTGVTQYLHGDLIGSTRLITSAAAAVAGTNAYDAYGNRKKHTGTTDSEFGYSGNWTDPITKLVYLRARDYDPATGQFLTVDPAVGATRQPYAYVANNPLQLTDPTGLAGTESNGCPGPGVGVNDPENVYVQSWAMGCLPSRVSYGAGDGLVEDLKQMIQTQSARSTLQFGLHEGLLSVGSEADASYSAGSPSLFNPNFARDMDTFSNVPGISPVANRIYAALGTYALSATVVSMDPKCQTAVVSFNGYNSTTLGSAIGFPETRDFWNGFAVFTGIGREVKQTFSWTEMIQYGPSR